MDAESSATVAICMTADSLRRVLRSIFSISLVSFDIKCSLNTNTQRDHLDRAPGSNLP